MAEPIIKQCKYCKRKMKAATEVQANYNLEQHEFYCTFRMAKK